jgi:hexokinase
MFIEEVGNMDEAAQQQLTPEGPISGVDFNIPLTDKQKFVLTSIRLKIANVQRQIADLQTTESKLGSMFQGELLRVGSENKIDMNNMVLNDDLDLKPKA